jgi:hypothetical protein
MGGDMDLAGAVPTMSFEARVTPRRVKLAVALVILNLADVILTKGVLAHGGVELNPLMAGLMAGFAAPMGVKFVVSALAGGLLLACPPRSRMAEPAALTMVGVYIAIVSWNAALLGWLAVTAN